MMGVHGMGYNEMGNPLARPELLAVVEGFFHHLLA